MERRKRDGIAHRLAEQTIGELTERETWYKKRSRDNDEEDSTRPRDKIATSSWMTGKKRKQMKTGEKKEVKSVIFVPHTINSELAQPKIR